MPSNSLKLTLLGSGTSMGVPSLGCHCRVCTSKDPRDNRLRPSVLLSRNGQHVVIDTTPDFRQQALRIGLQRLDALRDTPHPMHQTVEQALKLIDRLKPRRAWFTHIAHELPHVETNERLRSLGYPHVQLGYDGLELEVEVEDTATDPPAKTSSRAAPIRVFSSPAAW